MEGAALEEQRPAEDSTEMDQRGRGVGEGTREQVESMGENVGGT